MYGGLLCLYVSYYPCNHCIIGLVYYRSAYTILVVSHSFSIRFFVLTLYFHELIALDEGLLMKVVGIALIVYHADLTLVFRHEHVNITIQRITVVSTADYLTYTLSLASHVVKFRKVVEVVKAVDAQHKPSNFSTSVFSP